MVLAVANQDLTMRIPFCRRVLGLAAALSLIGGSAVSAQSVPEDPMVPPAAEAAARVSPLRMVTVTTGDMAATRRFYEAAMGMKGVAARVTGAAAARLARHWGMAPSPFIDTVLFTYPASPTSVAVRAVAVPATLPPARPGRDSKYMGPLGFGFASSDIPARQRAAADQGFTSSAGIKRMDFPRADGTTYNVAEIHWLAPDDMLVLGVDRGTMRPVGPVDAAARQGGVAYASALVGDIGRANRFLNDVVGLERRRAMRFPGGGPDGGMIGLERGEPVAFEQWFSGGSSTGYLVVMQRLERAREMPQATGFAARGIALWSFETPDLDAAVARFRKDGGSATIATVDLPGVGKRRAAVLRSPDNLAVELVAAVVR
jgi:catechol 2,3-dioxygenase-like lactoylglutathione lyase family enzyme